MDDKLSPEEKLLRAIFGDPPEDDPSDDEPVRLRPITDAEWANRPKTLEEVDAMIEERSKEAHKDEDE